MYNLLLNTTKNNKASMKTKVEGYSEKIAKVEEQHSMEVMLELNFTKSLLTVAGEAKKGYVIRVSANFIKVLSHQSSR